MAVRITTYEQAFDLISVPYDSKAIAMLARLEKLGHSEKSICYAIWRENEKLYKYRKDERFWGIFYNSVKQWSWPYGDPRWQEYWKKKEEEKRLEALEREMEKERIKYQDKKKYPGFIYFAQGVSGGAIKIGYATNVTHRLRSLQTDYPERLIAILIIPGDTNNEKALHQEFRHIKLHGEWFEPTPELMDKIAELEKAYYVKARKGAE